MCLGHGPGGLGRGISQSGGLGLGVLGSWFVSPKIRPISSSF